MAIALAIGSAAADAPLPDRDPPMTLIGER
jgi:hypothetical protein